MDLEENGKYLENEKKPLEIIEKAIIKRYRKQLWSKFIKAVKEFELIKENDKIAVAISGGKDSLLMAKMFQELKKNGDDNFHLEFIAMDPGYSKQASLQLKENCKYLNIPINYFETDIFPVANKTASEYPCYICARMRRGALYTKAEETGCNKLALGHHFDDVIETIMLNLLCAGNYKTMIPKLKSDNFENIEIIRPLYFIEESSIINWVKYSGVNPLNCACSVTAKKTGSKREEIKELIKSLEKSFKNVKQSIFKSSYNVNLDRVISYEKNGKKFSFLDDY